MHVRWDDFLQYPRHWTPRAPHRKERDFGNVEPARTLGEARERHIWLWFICRRQPCVTLLSVPLAPLLIRWGAEMALDDVRRRARCTRCGGLGLEAGNRAGIRVIGVAYVKCTGGRGNRTRGRVSACRR